MLILVGAVAAVHSMRGRMGIIIPVAIGVMGVAVHLTVAILLIGVMPSGILLLLLLMLMLLLMLLLAIGDHHLAVCTRHVVASAGLLVSRVGSLGIVSTTTTLGMVALGLVV